MSNPLAEGLQLRRRPDPCVLVIFGASGDLTQRKLFPALYSLAFRRLLPEQFAVVGVARTAQTSRQFETTMKAAVKRHARDPFRQDIWDSIADGLRYVATDFADDPGEDRVAQALAELDEERDTRGNRVYYLAVPPQAFETVVQELGERRGREGWTRVIVEKPFGTDLGSARDLNALLHRWFDESEVFRIDHYLGKETVQNMLALRFANGIFEPIWNRQFIDHVQITVAESMGIEGRSGFYEQAGAIRDVFQNHLLQLLALTAMEPPIDFTADSVRNEKVKVLRSLHTPAPKSIVRGQYGRGFVEGEEVPAYREEPGVSATSETETYVAAKLFVDNWRWADTPFYVRAGKRLARRETSIAIQFQRAPHPPFAELAGEGLRPNVLLIHVQPNEGVSLAIGAKVPGAGMSIRTVHMDFLYGGAFRTGLPEAYERLVLDAMLGDATLFTRETRSTSSGSSSTPLSAAGSATASRSPTTRPAAGARARRTTCCTATAAPGAATEARAWASSPRSSSSWRGCATRPRAATTCPISGRAR
jgi:glucose-6-phosphate 1-dehydrogenase